MSKWKQCVEYMQKANALPPLTEGTKRALLHSDPNIAYEVARYLKDGVVLCRLLNGICPMALPKKNFSSRPQNSKYLAKRNIEAFLNACESVFRMSKKDLFAIDDLLLERNLDKVLIAISKLSQTKLAQEFFGDGFFISAPPPPKPIPIRLPPPEPDSLIQFTPPPPRPFDDNDTYRNCNDLMIYQEEEQLYKTFIEVTQRASTCTGQISKKEMCIKELMSTEQNYVELLQALIKEFKIPLSSILMKNSIDKIFFKIEEIHRVHEDFLKKLEQCQNIDSRISVAECFISCKESFLLYGEYCANINDAQNHIDELLKNSDYRASIEKCEQNYKDGKIKFRDYFVIPMQRILKYPLFMRTCYNEDKDEFQKKILAKAIEEVEDLAQYVNEVKRDIENLKNIEKIEKSIRDCEKILPVGAQLKDYGKLVKDGELKVKELDKECLVFLFDKILLICTKAKVDLVVSSYCTLSKYQVQTQADKDGRSFTLINSVLSKDNVTFKAKDKADRTEWIKAIELSKENSNPTSPPNSQFHFKMHTYDTPTICDVCKKLLKGMFFQGYQCTNTKKNVHKECIPNIQSPISPTKQENLRLNSYGLVMIDYRGNPKPPVEFNALHLLAKSIVQILAVCGDWMQGRCDNRQGYFPKSIIIEFDHIPYVREIEKIFQDREEMVDSWFAGEIERGPSYEILENAPNGTFLVRKKGQDLYVIDIKYMKPCSIIIEKDSHKYCIEPDHPFDTVKLLVEFYEIISLGDSFSKVPTKLLFPYKEVLKILAENPRAAINLCKATFDYIPHYKDVGQLTLHKGDIINVLNTNVGHQGWWQGKLRNKVGYFPCSYVDYVSNE